MRAALRSALLAAVATGASGLAITAPAGAVTIGQLAPTSGGTCSPNEGVAQPTSAAPSYTIPAGGGVIDHWSTAAFSGPGASISLLVLTQLSSTSYQIDSFNTQVLPTPLPTPLGTTVTFTPTTPLQAPAGAVLGLYSGTPAGAACLFGPGGPSDTYSAGGPFGAPSDGATLTFLSTPSTGSRVNVAADLVQTIDAGLTTAAHPTVATAGGLAAFTFTLSNTGVSTGTTNFSDNIPNGLSIVSAAAGSGTCSTISQLVSCSVTLGPGASAPVSIVVSTSTAGTFTNTGTVTTSLTDPNPDNNAATASLTVNAASPSTSCHVITLKGVPLKVAKSILTALSCRPGTVSKKSSKSVPKGSVISTSPGSGSHPAGTKVKITVSSGKPHKHK